MACNARGAPRDYVPIAVWEVLLKWLPWLISPVKRAPSYVPSAYYHRGYEISPVKSLPPGVTASSRNTPRTEADSAEAGQEKASTAQKGCFQIKERATISVRSHREVRGTGRRAGWRGGGSQFQL